MRLVHGITDFREQPQNRAGPGFCAPRPDSGLPPTRFPFSSATSLCFVAPPLRTGVSHPLRVLVQWPARDVVHHVERIAPYAAAVVNADDVRMFELPKYCYLAFESRPFAVIGEMSFAQDLDRHSAPRGLLNCLIDHALSAPADLAHDCVPGKNEQFGLLQSAVRWT